MVADHIEDDDGDDGFLDARAGHGEGHAFAALESIIIAIGVALSLFAVEEGKADRVTEFGLGFDEVVDEAEEDAGTGATVVGALEGFGDAGLGIVVGAEEDDAVGFARDVDVEIAERFFAEGGVFGPDIGLGGEAHAANFLGDPAGGAGGVKGTGIAWGYLHEFRRVGEHFDACFRRETLPQGGVGLGFFSASGERGAQKRSSHPQG